jgi:hypothetical protein
MEVKKMVTKNEIENAIKIISGIIIDFSETVDDLITVKNILYETIEEPDNDRRKDNALG